MSTPRLGHRLAARIAQMARDSGAFCGSRAIVGGRLRIRRALYQATMGATAGSSQLSKNCDPFIRRNTPPKVGTRRMHCRVLKPYFIRGLSDITCRTELSYVVHSGGFPWLSGGDVCSLQISAQYVGFTAAHETSPPTQQPTGPCPSTTDTAAGPYATPTGLVRISTGSALADDLRILLQPFIAQHRQNRPRGSG